MNVEKVTVIGGGSFGTTIANMVADNGFDTALWVRDPKLANAINCSHENQKYLPGFKLNPAIRTSTDYAAAVLDTSAVIMAVPSSYFRTILSSFTPYLVAGLPVISTTKGIEANGFKLMNEVIREVAPQVELGILSGPNLAKEIIARQPTGTVIASANKDVRDLVINILGSEYFRVYSNTDVYGVELGGALKNIYAIVTGLATALQLGQNSTSLIITRSLAEMSRFAVTLGAEPMTFIGLSGVGDLVATCSSPLSRNFRIGHEIGKGKTLQQAVDELGQVAEGVNTLKLVRNKAKELNVYMPLVEGLYEVLFNNQSPMQVAKTLMVAQESDDVEFVVKQSLS